METSKEREWMDQTI